MNTAKLTITRGDLDDAFELELAIEGSVRTGSPATYWEPAEPWEAEMFQAVVVEDAPGYQSGTVIELTPDEREAAEQALIDQFDPSDDFEPPDQEDFSPDDCTGDCFGDAR